jgi:hypothetical protein
LLSFRIAYDLFLFLFVSLFSFVSIGILRYKVDLASIQLDDDDYYDDLEYDLDEY